MGKFSLDISKWVEKTKGDLDEVTRRATLAVANELIMRSPVGNHSEWAIPLTKSRKTGKMHFNAPVGYVGGRFRNNWQLGVGEMPTGEIENPDRSGKEAIARMEAAIPAQAAGKTYYIVNNLPYAMRLEYGWSKQAPVGMVGLTVVRWRNIVEDAVNGVKSGGGDYAAAFAAYPL